MASRIMLVGDPSAGKSTAAILGMLRAGKEVYVADFDCSTGDLRAGKMFRALPEEQQARLHYAPLADKTRWTAATNSDSNEGTSVAKMTVAEPYAIKTFLDVLQKRWDDGPGWADFDASKCLIIDSGTEFGESLVRLHMYLNSKSMAAMGIRDWKPCNQMESTIMDILKGLQCWVVVTYHLMHVNIGEYADHDKEVEGVEKKKASDLRLVKSDDRWPSTINKTGAREKPLARKFPIILKALRVGNRYIIQSEPDDDTPFLRCHVDLGKQTPGPDAIEKVVRAYEGAE